MTASHLITATSLLLASGLLLGTASADISLNLQGNSANPVTGTAGVVPLANWNNIAGQNNTGSALVDETGTATTADVTFSSGFAWAVGQSDVDSDDYLFDGYIISTAGVPTSTITFNNIPYTTYDVYVYVCSNVNTPNNGSVDVNGTGTVYYDAQGVFPWTAYTEATSTTSGTYDAANYVKFVGVTGSTVAINVTYPNDGSHDNGPAGVQIIDQSSAAVSDWQLLDD